MKSIAITMFVVMFSVLSGCSSTKTMNGIMTSWEGSDIGEVVAQWGDPHEVRDFQDRKLYVWNHTTTSTAPTINIRTTSISGHTGSSGSTTAGGSTTYGNCQRILEVNAQDRVVSWQWNGENCPYREDGPYANWRRKTPAP